MENRVRITYTVPRQIPLFEEKDDGALKEYERIIESAKIIIQIGNELLAIIPEIMKKISY